MIKSIHLVNVYSIKDSVVDFAKGRFAYKKDMIFNDRYINPLAIYGFNGSGKSSFIKALGYVVSIMNDVDNFIMEPNYYIVRETMKSKENYSYLVSKIEILFSINDVDYNYNVQVCDNKIIKEQLYVNAKLVLDRNHDSYVTELNYSIYNKLKKVDKSILFILKDKFSGAYDFLSKMIYIANHRTKSISNELLSRDLYDYLAHYSAEVKNLVSEYIPTEGYEIVRVNSEYYLKFEENLLPVRMLSSGMFNQNLIISSLLSLPRGGVLIVDELEKSLHPLVLQIIIKLATERKIQLIFSSNNTYLMQFLRPDQIYFASFNSKYTSLEKLSDLDKSIREVNNIEKMYLSYAFNK